MLFDHTWSGAQLLCKRSSTSHTSLCTGVQFTNISHVLLIQSMIAKKKKNTFFFSYQITCWELLLSVALEWIKWNCVSFFLSFSSNIWQCLLRNPCWHMYSAVFVFAVTARFHVSGVQRAKFAYLSMMTGSDGVSFLLPQLFLSQHRLQGVCGGGQNHTDKGGITKMWTTRQSKIRHNSKGQRKSDEHSGKGKLE